MSRYLSVHAVIWFILIEPSPNMRQYTSKTSEGRSATLRVQGSVFFFDLNCCTISCNISYKKKNIFQPSWAVLLQGLFFSFFDYFYTNTYVQGVSMVRTFFQRMTGTFGLGLRANRCLFWAFGMGPSAENVDKSQEKFQTMRREN